MLDAASGVLELQHQDTRFDARTQRLPQAMRSAILLVPTLLARFGLARIEDAVQGCTLSAREVDPHIEVLQCFGAAVERCGDAWLLRVARALLVQRGTMTGIVGADHYPCAGQAMMEMVGWIAAGKLKAREDIVPGLKEFPKAFDMLFSGANHAKLVLKVATD